MDALYRTNHSGNLCLSCNKSGIWDLVYDRLYSWFCDSVLCIVVLRCTNRLAAQKQQQNHENWRLCHDRSRNSLVLRWHDIYYTDFKPDIWRFPRVLNDGMIIISKSGVSGCKDEKQTKIKKSEQGGIRCLI